MLGELLDAHGSQVWLVNTGWSGGAYGVGARMKLSYTRAMVRAALAGKLDKAQVTPDPIFGLPIPGAIEGVPTEILSRATRGRTAPPMTRRRRSSPGCSRRTSRSSAAQCPGISWRRDPRGAEGRRWEDEGGRMKVERRHAGGSGPPLPPFPFSFHPLASLLHQVFVPTLRDPLWNNIRVEGPYLRLLDSSVFQRLRYVRQLGLAHLVYPGATHSRFEHALGAYHLARETVRVLAGSPAGAEVPADEWEIVTAAALLHDIGHYPFSHALEELGVPHHETVAEPLLCTGEIASILRESFAPDAPERVLALVRGVSPSPLQGLISGSIDLDKIDYLKRDAMMCGVAYGEIDVDRLRHALVLVRDPSGGRSWWGCARRDSRRWSRCCSPSTRCTGTCTGSTRCGAPPRCTSGWWRTRCAAATSGWGTWRATRTRGSCTRWIAARRGRCSTPSARAGSSSAPWRRPRRASRISTSTGSPRTATGRARRRMPSRAPWGWPRGSSCWTIPARNACWGSTSRCSLRTDACTASPTRGWRGRSTCRSSAEQLYQSARWLRVFTAERREIAPDRVLEALAHG
jgi:hypothetical protein